MSDDNVIEFQPRLINQWPRKVYLADTTSDGSELRVYDHIQHPDDTTPLYVRGDLYDAQAARIRELEAELAALREARGTPAQAARVLLDEWRHGEGPLGDLACYSMDEDAVMRPDIDGRWTEFPKIEAALFRASLADAGEAG